MMALNISHLMPRLSSLMSHAARVSISSRSLNSDQRKPEQLLNEVYEAIRMQRFERIVVVQTKFDTDPRYYIIADAFNRRHLSHGTEMINKLYKQQIKNSGDEFAVVSESESWNVMDLRSIVVHLFLGDTRETYDLEQLWTVGPEFDEQSIHTKSLPLGKKDIKWYSSFEPPEGYHPAAPGAKYPIRFKSGIK